MDAQEQNLCLVNMPELVLEKILSNIHNPSNVSRSCKYLYDIVCRVEKHRRVMRIKASDLSPINIDADATFDSIMNSHRTIEEMELRVDGSDDTLYRLNERQLERMTAIMKRFGSNVTSLKFEGFALPINFILEMLQQASKLESLSFTYGKGIGSVTKNTATSLQLPSLKALEIYEFPGLMDVVNLINAGSLNSIWYNDRSTKSTEVLTGILTKQHNIKSLIFGSDLTAFGRVDHLQLETLIFTSHRDKDSQLVELLKCHTNLKELRFKNFYYALSGNVFQWICSNLKKLEVLEVQPTIEGKFEMLGELKQLRHFRANNAHNLFHNGSKSLEFFKCNSVEKFEIGILPVLSSGSNKIVNSMAHNLPNLTHLTMKFENFSALCFVLSRCTKIIHLTCNMRDPNPGQLTQQRFPNIQHLELCRHDDITYDTIHMTSIARAMPNLKSMSLKERDGITFDVNAMRDFINEIKNLEYFSINRFELHRKLSTDDVMETIRCLTDQLKGYRIYFSPSKSSQNWNWYKIKEILFNKFNVRGNCWNWHEIMANEFYVRHDYCNRPTFYLYKEGKGELGSALPEYRILGSRDTGRFSHMNIPA